MNYIELYKNYLQTIKEDKQNEVVQLTDSHCYDDAKFKKIELNIIEIFEQMLSASEKKVQAAKAKNSQTNYYETLNTVYLDFFEKIPTNWKQSLQEAQKHHDEETIFIETLKLNQAELIKTAFTTFSAEVEYE